MMSPLSTIMTVVIPLTLFFLPGAAIVWRHAKQPLVVAAALGGLWSTGLLLLGTLLASWLGIPVVVIWLLAFAATIIVLRPLVSRGLSRHAKHQQWLVMAAVALLLFAVFSIPFLLFHDGLPTGDSQKSILWGLSIIENNTAPDYGLSPALLNRDPVDFFTPALHSYTALAMRLAPDPLTAVGLLAVAMAVGVVVVAAAIARTIFPVLPRLPLVMLTALLLLTQLRFLRYIREPGYHWQNLVGEFLLFGALLVCLLLLDAWQRDGHVGRVHGGLLLVLLAALLFSHQFSAFLAAFVLLPVVLLAVRELWRKQARISRRVAISMFAVVIVGVVGGSMLGLHRKVAHFFTLDPHLLPLTPDLIAYPRLMGIAWLALGLGGLLYLLRRLRVDLKDRYARAAFTLSTVILLALSQGPRLGIDIPPVRALFYSAVPLSIMGAAFLLTLDRLIRSGASVGRQRWLRTLLIVLVVVGTSATSARAWQLSHTVRTNSTLTQEQMTLIDDLSKAPSGAVLVDDYNRRSSSWLVLSGHPMYTRIASDLARQMEEARQSALRYNLYLNQLDYEKIFSLGGLDLALDLMAKHGITYVTGIDGSSGAQFANNPGLAVAYERGDIALLAHRQAEDTCSNRLSPQQKTWLLRTSTIANDIGDTEDTFLHLPVSLQGALVSAPHAVAGCSVRSLSAAQTPLKFNIGDYLTALWDREGTDKPDTAVELLVDIVGSPTGLFVRDALGTLHPLVSRELLRLEPRQVPIDDRGFITLTLVNPNGTVVDINLIALGLARIP